MNCFVLMPFSDDFNNPWKFAVMPAAKNNGLVTFRADDESRPMGKITRDITKSIIDAYIIIAEMTGLSPNVTYELGLAHAAKKRVIMITQNTEEIPFDLHDIRHIPYDINQLEKLEDDLSKKIRIMLDIPEGGEHDFFPELKVMTQKEKTEKERMKKENSDLASLAHGIRITTKPKFAYIFFNNRYIGVAPQMLHVNPYNDENIVTVYTIEHFEEYKILSKEDLEKKHIHIDLEKRNPDLFPKRVHKWLKYIRKQPNDVVIGHAITTYLDHIGEHEEAVQHLKELLRTCDNWSMLYNRIGYSLSLIGKPEESLDYYLKVKELEASFISHYNLACTYSRLHKFDKCLLEIREITNNKQFIGEIFEIWSDENVINGDSAFDNIRSNPDYGEKFEELNQQYKEIIKELQSKKQG